MASNFTSLTAETAATAVRRFPTDAGLGVPVFCASVAGVGIYATLAYATKMQGRTWDLFMGSWVQQVEIWLFLVVLIVLWRKQRLIEHEAQRVAYVREHVLRALFSDRIASDDVPVALKTMRARLDALRLRDLLSARSVKVLCALGTSGSPATALEIMRAADGLDREQSDATFTSLRTLLWALPILGFIGTVLGIGDAVAGFSDFVARARDLHAVNMGMRDQLGAVTHGLAVAFDTTLLGLAFSLPGVFVMAMLRRREDQLLTDMEQFGFDAIIPSLSARPASTGGPMEGTQTVLRNELDNLVRVVRVLRGVVVDMLGDVAGGDDLHPPPAVAE